MIFTKIKIDNFYLFKDFEYDLTFPRLLSGHNKDNIFDGIYPYGKSLKYKKVNIIIGSNASGKTTFGTLLNNIQNLLYGNTLFLEKIINDKTTESIIEIEFYLDKYFGMYQLKINNDNDLNLSTAKETIKLVTILKNDNKRKLNNKLSLEKGFEMASTFYNNEFKSEIIKNKIESDMTIQKLMDDNISFNYRTSKYLKNNDTNISLNKELLNKVLCSIDNSVKDISLSYKDNEFNDYRINFKNGDSILIEDGNISKANSERLSSGTIQAIYLADLLANYKQTKIKYLDEKMCNMHAELENAIIIKLAEITENTQQLFITTHSESVLDLNIPIHAIALFKRDDYINLINPSLIFKKNDRNLNTYIKNDYFNTYPSYNEIWEMELKKHE
ncbi:MAG: ATP-binding protein [Bacilli bacterium]|jgi:ABC-type cobalamin/Fe3+-siderophores transport system ATPase subunit|nr:ATP-binding protein [Bacilli bacterium]